MGTKQIKKRETKNITYDSNADVLYMSCGKPRPGIALEVKAGDLVRIDPYTDEIVGITIIDFRERYKPPASDNIEEFAMGICAKILEAMGHSRSHCKC